MNGQHTIKQVWFIVLMTFVSQNNFSKSENRPTPETQSFQFVEVQLPEEKKG
jgi:hypothetical protein